MGGLFTAPSPPPPPPPPPVPTQSSAEVQAAADRERRQRAMANGQASTILTSGQGVTGDQVANPASKTLLGT